MFFCIKKCHMFEHVLVVKVFLIIKAVLKIHVRLSRCQHLYGPLLLVYINQSVPRTIGLFQKKKFCSAPGKDVPYRPTGYPKISSNPSGYPRIFLYRHPCTPGYPKSLIGVRNFSGKTHCLSYSLYRRVRFRTSEIISLLERYSAVQFLDIFMNHVILSFQE